MGLGSCAFARHYLRYHCCFLFLRVLRCFSSPGSLPPSGGYHAFGMVGCPIRTPTDQALFAGPRSFSQLTTSFFASESLGIPHTPFSTSSNLILKIQLTGGLAACPVICSCHFFANMSMNFLPVYSSKRLVTISHKRPKASSNVVIKSMVNGQQSMVC